MVGYTGKAKKYTTNVREAGSAANMIKIWTCTASKKREKYENESKEVDFEILCRKSVG